MNSKQIYPAYCMCRATGKIHAAACGCHRADEFLAAPVEAYSESRRAFFRALLAGGVTVAVLPLLETQASADIFRPSVADQKRLGDQAAAQVVQKYHEVKDS